MSNCNAWEIVFVPNININEYKYSVGCRLHELNDIFLILIVILAGLCPGKVLELSINNRGNMRGRS